MSVSSFAEQIRSALDAVLRALTVFAEHDERLDFAASNSVGNFRQIRCPSRVKQIPVSRAPLLFGFCPR